MGFLLEGNLFEVIGGGGGSPTVVATESTVVGGLTLTFNKPGGLADDDVVYAYCSKDDNLGPYTDPGGWTTVSSVTATTGNDGHSTLFRKVITDAASESATWVFSTTDSEQLAGAMVVVRGADNTTPEDVTAAHTHATDNNQFTSPTVTTTQSDTLVLWMGNTIGGGTTTAVEPLTVDGSILMDGNTGFPHGGIAYAAQAAAGASGTRQWLNLPSDLVTETQQTTIAVAPA